MDFSIAETLRASPLCSPMTCACLGCLGYPRLLFRFFLLKVILGSEILYRKADFRTRQIPPDGRCGKGEGSGGERGEG